MSLRSAVSPAGAVLVLSFLAATGCTRRGEPQCTFHDSSVTDEQIAETSAAAFETFRQACLEQPPEPNYTYFGTPGLIVQFRLDPGPIGCHESLPEELALCVLGRFADVWGIRSPSAELALSRVEYFPQWDEVWVQFDQVYDGYPVTPVGLILVVFNGDGEVTQVQADFRPNINVVNQGDGCVRDRFGLFDRDRATAHIAARYSVDATALHLEEVEDVVYYTGAGQVNEAWAARLVRAWCDGASVEWSEPCGYRIFVDVESNEPLDRLAVCVN